MTPLGSTLLIGGLAALVLLAVLSYRMLVESEGTAAREPSVIGPEGGREAATAPGDYRDREESRGRERGDAGPIGPRREEAPPLPEEDLWAMIPDQYHLEELQEHDFRLNGGVDSPGTDPEGARRAVNEPGWAERMEADLRRGLESKVLIHGMGVRHLACERGRCLVELTFASMGQAFERVDAIRRWLEQDVPCHAYTEGPSDEESPFVQENQQIWILCGEPTDQRGRERSR